jgi:hypothetical protein
MGFSLSRQHLTLALLTAGMAAPLLYYGLQAAAAPFYPGFSFVGTTASELGSDLSPQAPAFNAGIILLGAATLLASAGFWRALRRLGASPALALPTSLAVAANGVQSLWAGLHPMPDPRHGGHPAFILAMILLPPLLTAALWRHSRSRVLQAYLLATLALLAVMIPLMSGATGLDTHTYRGLLQRVFTLTIFPPIGVAAYVLARRVRASARNDRAKQPS